MNLAFNIAWRYTLGNSEMPFSRLINRMSIIGLTLGVALLILVLSVMNGFDKELRQRILAIIPHISIFSDRAIHQQEWQQVVDANPHVRFATPYSDAIAMAVHGERIESIIVYAIDTELEKNNTTLIDILTSDLITALEQPNTIALGSSLAQKLNKQMGDNITIYFSDSTITSNPSNAKTFIIGALLNTATELDNTMALVHLNSFHPEAESEGIRVMVDDLFNSYAIAIELLTELPEDFRALTWAQTHGTLYEAIQTSRSIVMIMVFLLLIIAAFNVLSSLMILSAEKQKDIAVLKRWELSKNNYSKFFVFRGCLLAVLVACWV